MKKVNVGLFLLFVCSSVFAVKPTHNEITSQEVRWFEMKFKEEKVPRGDKRLRKVYLLLGFRHHLRTARESAYLSLYVLTDKGTIDWQRYMFLEGNSTLDGENSKTYKVETCKQEEGLNIFEALSQELYRLDLLEINTPEDLVEFYEKNFKKNRTYYLILREKMAVLAFSVSQKNFCCFFRSLANPSEKDLLQNPKKIEEDLKEKLLQPYNLLLKNSQAEKSLSCQ